MPFGINDKVVVAPFGVKDKVEEEAIPLGISDVASEEEVLPTPTQDITKPVKLTAPAIDRGGFKPLPEEEPVDLMGLGSEYQTVGSFDSTATAKRSYTTIPEVATNKEKVADIRKFMSVRYPNMVIPKDDKEAVKSFVGTLSKSDFDLSNDLTWALNATDEQKIAAQKAINIGKDIPTQLSDEVVATLKSPSTYVGGLAGFGVRKAATQGIKKAITVAVTVAGTEAVVSGLQNVVTQKGDLALGRATTAEAQQTLKDLGAQQDYSYAQTAIVAAVGAVFGGIEGVGLAKASKNPKEQMAALIAKNKKTPTQLNAATQELLAKFQAREKEIYTDPLFASKEARQEARQGSLDVIDTPQEVTDAVLNKETIKGLFDTAKQLFIDDPTLLPDINDTRSITQLVIDTLEKSGVDSVQQAAKLAGVNEKEFFDAFKVTVSEAGTVLQNSSALARSIGKLIAGQDPELDAVMKRIAEGSHGQEYMTGSFMTGVKNVTDASVGLAVSSLSTTILNTAGLVGAVTFNTLVDVVDATIRHSDRLIGDMRGNVAINKSRIKETTDGIMTDSFYAIGRIFDSGYSNELYDSVMKFNPRLNNMLIQTSPDVDRAGMNKYVDMLNAANRSVEMFVRKPMLVSSLRTRMQDLGLSFDDFAANNRPIPPALLEQSVNDTLALTFSSGFRKTGEKSIEGVFEGAASTIVRTVNENTLLKIGANIVMPFYRFGLNSLRYSYRMTPMSLAGGMLEFKKSASLKRQATELAAAGKGKEAKEALYASAGVAYEGRRKMIESSIGMGIIAGAMMDRENNADLSFDKTRNSKGEVADIGTLAPFSFVYAMAEAALIMKDMAQDLYYTMSMTPEERVKEAQLYKDEAAKTDVIGEKQALINKAELLELQRIRDFDGARFMEILAGWGRMGGTQKTILDNIKDIFEESITSGSTLRSAGAFVGDFASRFDNFLNPVYDLYNLMADDYRQVDSRAPTTLDLPAFADAAIAAAASQVPPVKQFLQDKPSLFQEQTPQMASFTRYLTGEKPVEPTDAIQNELLRLNIEPYRIYKRSGDRNYDNLRVKVAGPVIREAVTDLLADPDYKDQSKNEQVVSIEKRISDAFAETREESLDLYSEQDEKGSVVMRYKGMSKKERQAAEDRFVKENGTKPTTLDEMRAIIDGEYSTAKDIGSFASGGLVKQTNKLLAK